MKKVILQGNIRFLRLEKDLLNLMSVCFKCLQEETFLKPELKEKLLILMAELDNFDNLQDHEEVKKIILFNSAKNIIVYQDLEVNIHDKDLKIKFQPVKS